MNMWTQQREEGFIDFDLEASDASGMTFLHHAAREGYEEILVDLLKECPQLANTTTYSCKKPGCWTALQCLSDLGVDDKYKSRHAFMAKSLAEHMTQEAVFNVTTNRTCVFHQLVSHGHDATLEVLLPLVRRRS